MLIQLFQKAFLYLQKQKKFIFMFDTKITLTVHMKEEWFQTKKTQKK